MLNRRVWNNVLTVPTRNGLQGRWELRGDRETWTTTVEGGNLWGGIGVWISSRSVEDPARLILRFDLTDRHIDPELVEHDTSDGATKG